MQNDLAGELVSPQLDLLMECYGWQGNELQFLGSLRPEGLRPEELNLQENGIRIIIGEGINAEVAFELFELPDLPDIYPIGSENDWGGDILMKPLQIRAISSVSSEIPEYILDMTTDPNICGEHLPSDAQNFLGQVLYCFPYPEYDLNKGATMPQPYLVWHNRSGEIWGFKAETVCLGGINEECKSYPELLDLAEETGGQVGFDVISMGGGISTIWQVTEADLTMFVVPPLPCTGDTQFSVRLWYQPGNEGLGVYSSQETQIGKGIHLKTEKYYGPISNWVTIPCKPSNESKEEEVQYLEISFRELSTRALDDGGDDYINIDEDVELYGYFRVKAPSMGHWFETPCLFDWASSCDEPMWTGSRRYLLVADWEEDEDENLLRMGPAPHHYPDHELKYLELCQATSKYSCKYDGQATSYKTNNNKLRVFVKEGDALTFEMMLVDHDSLSDDDVVCVGSFMTPSKSLSEWGNIDDYYVIHGDMTDSGACDVDFMVKAVYGP
jgi:hypothetical protein